MTDQLSAAETARLIKARDMSPVEAVEAAISRIETRNPSINAMIFSDFDGARAEARAAEARLMKAEPAELGPLFGVPTAMKDCADFKPGWPSTFGGIRCLAGNIAEGWCTYAERMTKAGAILIGKTNSPQMGFRGTTDNKMFGPTSTPFKPGYNAGGSSGGGAAIVGDGMLPIAEGTDGGGSIRIPAAWCGVYGYKASFGRVPCVTRPNAFGGSSPFIFEGTLTRTVEDAALGLAALAGYDPRDPFSLEGDFDALAALSGGVKGWRIAYCPDFGNFPVEPAVAAVVREAVAAFEAAGAIVEEIDIDFGYDQLELSEIWCRMSAINFAAALEDYRLRGYDILGEHPDDMPPEVHAWYEVARGLTIADKFRDQAAQTAVYDRIQEVMGKYRLLLTPTNACLPVRNATDGNTLGPSAINGVTVNPIIGWCMTYPVNYSGHPAASIPAGLDPASGLPVGMQIIGRRYADADVLAASAAFETARPWMDSYRIPATRLG